MLCTRRIGALLVAHAEHAVRTQGVRQHLAVAFLIDIKGQQAVREQMTLRQHHDRQDRREGHINRVGH